MDYSVVIPLFNERDNLAPLHAELTRVMQALGRPYELVFVDDGSSDGGIEVLRDLKASDSCLHVIRLARNSGQTAALACGFKHASGEVIVAMDADLQNDPADIPRLLASLDQGNDLASGWRTARWQKERFTRRLPSIAANSLISTMTGVRLHDYGCTFKAYRQGARIAEVEVGFRQRRAGTSKYGLGRIVRTLLDLITVKFLSGYSTAPIQFFGLIGFLLGGLGSIWTAILVAEKIVLGHPLGNRPALLLAVLLVVVGVQFVSIGLLGEMLARTYHESQGKPIYIIKEEF